MRKIFFYFSLVLFTWSFISCDDDVDDNTRSLNYSDLPSASISFMNEHFSGATNENTETSKILYTNYLPLYQVHYDDYTIQFDINGLWRKVDGKKDSDKTKAKKLPNSFIELYPVNKIVQYIETKHPGQSLVCIDKIIKNFIVHLDNTPYPIDFDLEGNFVNPPGNLK